MFNVTIMLVNSKHTSDFYFFSKTDDFARQLVKDGEYTSMPSIQFDKGGELAADEMFDLTNNPSRQEERNLKYGRNRSLSVGDIVKVNDEMFLCLSFGWKAL